MSVARKLARFVSWAGLTGAGGLHLVWGSGSSWPAKNRKVLAQSVAGSAKGLPEGRVTAQVAGAAIVGGAIAGGALGEGRFIVGVRRLLGLGLLARGIAGGERTLSALGMPAGGKRFAELDRKTYRPLFIVLGLAVLLGARKSKRTKTQPDPEQAE